MAKRILEAMIEQRVAIAVGSRRGSITPGWKLPTLRWRGNLLNLELSHRGLRLLRDAIDIALACNEATDLLHPIIHLQDIALHGVKGILIADLCAGELGVITKFGSFDLRKKVSK